MSAIAGKKTAVIVKSQFTLPNKKSPSSGTRFNDYLTYISRDETTRDLGFSSYNEYMRHDQKSNALFNDSEDHLNDEKVALVKEAFKLAQARGSILYQDVISFDNAWLQEHGIYDGKTKDVDEKKLKSITRFAMIEMKENSGLGSNVVWSGAIHHNTENIHIHIATVNLSPSENQRGKRKLKTLERMRSIYVNHIMDRTEQRQKLNDLIRKEMVGKKKARTHSLAYDRSFRKTFLSIYKQLPKNKRNWNYGYETINSIKPELNQLTKKYLDMYHPKEINEFHQRLDEEVSVLRRTYGEGEAKRYDEYKTNKINDLYQRMGNAFLQEMKAYDNQIKTINQKHSPRSKKHTFQRNVSIKNVKYRMDRLFQSEMQSQQNQHAYERMQKRIERGQSL